VGFAPLRILSTWSLRLTIPEAFLLRADEVIE